MSCYELRYYAPDFNPATHDAILSLLHEIKNRHEIPYDVVSLSGTAASGDADNLSTDFEQQKSVYERDFLTRKGVLRHRTGQSLRRLLRSQKGNYFVAGTVAVTSNGHVEWFAYYGQDLPRDPRGPAVAFLAMLLVKGPGYLVQLCTALVRTQPEQELLAAFLQAHVLKGAATRELPVGNHRFAVDHARFDWRKSIDLVIESDTEVWILEAKLRLNYEALGEVLTYGLLYQDAFPQRKARLGIVCGSIDREILRACHQYDVTIFEIRNGSVEVHWASDSWAEPKVPPSSDPPGDT